MDKGNEFSNPEVAPDNKDLALRGMGLFVKVSLSNPASVIGQAAYIAKKCKDWNLDPLEIGRSLSAREDLVERIKATGNKRHAEAGAKRVDPLSSAEVTTIIKADFGFANDLMLLTHEQLQDIYGFTGGKPTSNAEEVSLARTARDYLKPLGVHLDYLAILMDLGFEEQSLDKKHTSSRFKKLARRLIKNLRERRDSNPQPLP